MEHISDILENAPDNWGKWGSDDELGALNYLDSDNILKGVGEVKKGESFALGIEIGGRRGAPLWPSRSDAQHFMSQDKGHIEAGKVDRKAYGNTESADDVINLFNHGTTHVDALGHVWYDDQLYNGFDANTTKGGLDRCGVENQAESGIVGRGVLLDIARHRDVDYLDSGARVTLEEIIECAEQQGVQIQKGDILLLRLGVIELFYEEGAECFYEYYGTTKDGEQVLNEPGLTYTDELISWFNRNDISLYATDSVASEQTFSEETDTRLPLHPALLRDLGVVISELNDLKELATDCAKDGNYEFLYMAAPLKIKGGSGSPINPLVIK